MVGWACCERGDLSSFGLCSEKLDTAAQTEQASSGIMRGHLSLSGTVASTGSWGLDGSETGRPWCAEKVPVPHVLAELCGSVYCTRETKAWSGLDIASP